MSYRKSNISATLAFGMMDYRPTSFPKPGVHDQERLGRSDRSPGINILTMTMNASEEFCGNFRPWHDVLVVRLCCISIPSVVVCVLPMKQHLKWPIFKRRDVWGANDWDCSSKSSNKTADTSADRQNLCICHSDLMLRHCWWFCWHVSLFINRHCASPILCLQDEMHSTP